MEQIIETPKEEKKSREKLFKIISSIVGIFIIVVLIIIKTQSANFPLFWVVTIGILILLTMFLIWFGFDWYRKFKELKETKTKNGLPEAITLEQAADLIEKQLRSPRYADYAVGWQQHKCYNAGKDGKTRVLLVQLEKTPYHQSPYMFVIMNMHYPRDLWDIIIQEKYNVSELIKAVNAVALSPSEEPDIRTIEEESPLTGVRRTISEPVRTKEAKKEDKEGDLK